MGHRWSLLKFNNMYQFATWLFMCLVSFASTILVLVDGNRPRGYGLLFLLPLVFAVCSILFAQVYTYLYENIGATLILCLMFIRVSVLSLMMSFYGYKVRTISVNTDDMPYAVLLMVYELVVVFGVMAWTLKNKSDSKTHQLAQLYEKRKHTNRMYLALLIIALLVLAWCINTAPELLMGYRTIFQIGEENFTGYEDAYLVAEYGTTTRAKFALVTGNYLMRVLLAIAPAFLIVKLSKQKNMIRRFLAFLCCFIPFFFIGGVIARSLIYSFCLLLLHSYCYTPEKASKKSAVTIILACFAVIAWWAFRSDDAYEMQQLTSQLNAYCTGVNNVCAAFNLSGDIETRLSYFIYDFMDAIPYGGTIFNSSHTIFSEFFNSSCGSRGQIAPTIGVSNFYFGSLLAPVYSAVFAYISIQASAKIKSAAHTNTLSLIRLLLIAMYFAMGIVMYNVSITFTNYFSILLPMFIMERLAYKNQETTEIEN